MSDSLRERFDGYIGDLFTAEDEVLRQIKANTEQNDLPVINIQPFEGYLLGWLTRLVNARVVVEIGTLAGYSGTWIARSLPEEGRLLTVEKSSKHAEVARNNFELAGLSEKVEVLQGDAVQVLDKLTPRGPFDLVFIDADKQRYPDYLAWAAVNLRPGGLVTAHNAFRHGGVLEPDNDSDHTMRQFNEALAHDSRLDGFILPLGDGMAVGRKK